MSNYEVETRERRIGFMYAGLPGAGKTTVAELAAELTNGVCYNTGDVVRELAEQEGVDTSDSEQLGQWASDVRDHEGPAAIPEKMIGAFLDGRMEESYPMHIDGVRNIAGVMELRKYLTDSFLVLVRAPRQLRLERIQERDREGEGDFDEFDLLQRDQRELNELGTATILDSDQVDIIIENDFDSLGPLRGDIQQMVNDYTNYRQGELHGR